MDDAGGFAVVFVDAVLGGFGIGDEVVDAFGAEAVPNAEFVDGEFTEEF